MSTSSQEYHVSSAAEAIRGRGVGGGNVLPGTSVWFNIEASLRSIAHSLIVLAEAALDE